MIDSTSYPFYLSYVAIAAVLFVIYLKVKSTEPMVITTKEFRKFQSKYLVGYALSLLGELTSNAFFFYVFSEYSVDRAIRYYLVSVVSTFCFSVVIQIVDIGSRKNKAMLSALLYTLSMVSISIGDDRDVLFIGRVLYGAAAAYHHSSFESYVVAEHASQGFPEEWLAQTFARLTHIIALLGVIVGALGQGVAGMGQVPGVIGLSTCLFGGAGMYVLVAWTPDVNTPSFQLSGFLTNMLHTALAARKSRPLSSFILVSLSAETAFTVFSYYWAQLIASIFKEQQAPLPFALVFSCCVCASMVGAYAHSLLSAKVGADTFFQGVLSGLVAAFSLASMVQTPGVVFMATLVIYALIGAYWPCIGVLRGRCVGAEQRSSSQILSRAVSCFLTVVVLSHLQHSTTLVLISCALMVALAAFFQSHTMQQDGASTSYDYRKKEIEAEDAA